MTATAVRRKSGSATLGDVVLDRSAVARELADFILNATSRLVVLHGRRASGKSALVRNGVVPALTAAGRRVAYGDCTPALPLSFAGPAGPGTLEELLAGDHIVIIDSFDNLLDLPRDVCTEQEDQLFARLKGGGRGSMLVLIVDSRHLTGIYALAAYDPDFAGVVKEIPPIGIVDALEQLRRLEPGKLSFAPDLLEALAADARALAERGWELTADLPALVFAQLKVATTASDATVLNLVTYKRLGGIAGMLRGYLDERLEVLDKAVPRGAEVARAVLELVITSRKDGVRPKFLQLAERLPAGLTLLSDVRHRLLEEPTVALLRRTADHDYELVPPQLGAIVAERMERRRPDVERAQRLVEEGVRSWERLGLLMPVERFAEVHAHRAELTPDAEELRFLLRCALSHGSGELGDAPAYWLDRNPDASAGQDLLLGALFDSDAMVRGRAASLLTRYTDPEVVDRLFLLAVSDPDPVPDVRAAVIASLGAKAFKSVCERVLAIVGDRSQPHRAEAIEVLRVFPEERVVALLHKLVEDPTEQLPERAMAIRVLAQLERTDAVDALLRIALTDEDQPDRDKAGDALGTLATEELNQHLLAKLNVASEWRKVLWTRFAIGCVAVVIGGLTTMAILFGAEALAISPRRVLSGEPGVLDLVGWGIRHVYDKVPLLGPIIVGGIILSMLGGRALRRLRDGRVRWRSAEAWFGVLAFALSAATIAPVMRGLAHASVGRRGRAAGLLGVGLYAAFLWVVGSWIDRESVLTWFYIIAGAVLLAWSYAADVVGALNETVLLAGTVEDEYRRRRIGRKVLANPVGARVTIAALEAKESRARHQAEALLEHHGDAADAGELMAALRRDRGATASAVTDALSEHREATVKQLEELWADADAPFRSRIAAILWKRPGERSLEALDRHAHEMSLAARIRHQVARSQYRLRVWPTAAWIALALLMPAGIRVLYHGFKAIDNQAWAQIQVLYRRSVRTDLKVAVVGFLAENQPGEAGKDLLELLNSRRYVRNDSLHAALALGVMNMLPANRPVTADVRYDLVVAGIHFRSRLTFDSLTFLPALDVLIAMAAFRDTVVSALARRALTDYVRLGSESAPAVQERAVIRSLGTLPPLISLPLLDRLLGASRDASTRAALLQQIERTGLHAIEEVPQESVIVKGEPLVAALHALSRGSTTRTLRSAIAEIDTTVRDAGIRALSLCPTGANQACRERAAAIRSAIDSIAVRPDSEEGYLDLLAAYDTAFAAAAEMLANLRDRYPRSVWPGKSLSTLYHEQLAPKDPSLFRRSFEEVRRLRSRRGYRESLDSETWQRFEADYAEIALTAGQYDSLHLAVIDLLDVSAEPRYRYNMALFEYFGAVMRRDVAAARRHLDSLELVMADLGPAYYNGWRYDGTVAWLDHSGLPTQMKVALKALCREGFWFKGTAAADAVSLNRAALAALGSARR